MRNDSGNSPQVFVLVPIRNERRFLPEFLSWLETHRSFVTRIYLIDGNSTDGSRELLTSFARKDPARIRVLANPDGYVPHGLNRALREILSVAEDQAILIRLDVHTKYEDRYLEKVVQAFQEIPEADGLGPPQRTDFHPDSCFQEAVAYAMSHPFGVGDSLFHYYEEGDPRQVHSVYLGAWRAYVFRTIGGFNEELIRNQDDEFHARMRKYGFSLWLVPTLRVWYYPRDKPGALFRQFLEYGLYKPIALARTPQGFSWRHLVPAMFVLILPGVLPVYLLVSGGIAFFGARKLRMCAKMWLPFVFFLMHTGYGLGFLAGLVKLIFVWWKRRPPRIPRF